MTKHERITLSDQHNLCGVALWTTNLFTWIGYIRPLEYDSSICAKMIYHARTILIASTHFGEEPHFRITS